jgi:hypothetical protein
MIAGQGLRLRPTLQRAVLCAFLFLTAFRKSNEYSGLNRADVTEL